MLELIRDRAIDGRVDQVPLGDDNRFWALAKALNAGDTVTPFERRQNPIIALDPGETTGFAFWDPANKRMLLAQIDTKEVGKGFDRLWGIINPAVNRVIPLSHVRYEDYRVYGHMTEQHAFSHLHTARVIGAIEVACHLAQVPSSCCLAMHAKSFWTDDKLKMCNLYNRGMKHARDAERHLLRYMGEKQ